MASVPAGEELPSKAPRRELLSPNHCISAFALVLPLIPGVRGVMDSSAGSHHRLDVPVAAGPAPPARTPEGEKRDGGQRHTLALYHRRPAGRFNVAVSVSPVVVRWGLWRFANCSKFWQVLYPFSFIKQNVFSSFVCLRKYYQRTGAAASSLAISVAYWNCRQTKDCPDGKREHGTLKMFNWLPQLQTWGCPKGHTRTCDRMK